MRKQNSRKKLYISLFIIAVMVLSTFGVYLSASGNSSDGGYNGFTFRQKNNQWITKVNDKDYAFFFHPLDLTMDVPQEIITAIRQSPSLTLTFDPNMSQLQYADVARFELSQFLAFDLGKNVENAVLNKTSVYNLPIAACSGTEDKLFITFIEANESKAFIENNCITIATDNPTEYLGYAEKIIYSLLGIVV